MKKLSLFALAAAGMLFGACSSNDDVVDAVVNPAEFTDGAFIGISLSLPSADATTRANDDLSNGTEDEFAVKNATLYIFNAPAGTTNPDVAAKYVAKVSLGNTYDPDKEGGIDPDEWGVQEGVDVTNITSTYNKATLIPNQLASQMKADTENDYYAYVIINHNGQVEVNEGDTFEDFCTQEFEEIGADIAAEKNIWETGLLMTNAPICDKKGGSAAPVDGAKYTTLVPLDNTKIFGSRAAAEADPAGCVYVERAAVKITVEDGRGTNTSIGEGETAVPVTILGWQVINNERTYYNTRQIEAAWGPYTNEYKAAATNKYRFVSLYQFEPTLPPNATEHTLGFRTYFAKDVHYDVDAQAAVTPLDGGTATPSTLDNTVASDDRPWIAVNKHAYTTENTFDVKHQTWRNTTMVTIKAQIGENGFYTVGKGSQVMYPTAEKAFAAIENIVKGDNDVALALTALRKKISENNPTKEVTSGLKVEFETAAPTEGKTDVKFKVSPEFLLAGAPYDDFDNSPSTTGEPTEQELANDLADAITAVIKADVEKDITAEEVLLSFYKDGVSFYNVRIQHFGEAETPWKAENVQGGGANVDEIYGIGLNPDNSTPNFLGRYGVVRDNWYKLNIQKIGKIGDAEPVDPSTTTPDTPDDEIENFISVHVHIVPWVLRSQIVEF